MLYIIPKSCWALFDYYKSSLCLFLFLNKNQIQAAQLQQKSQPVILINIRVMNI